MSALYWLVQLLVVCIVPVILQHCTSRHVRYTNWSAFENFVAVSAYPETLCIDGTRFLGTAFPPLPPLFRAIIFLLYFLFFLPIYMVG